MEFDATGKVSLDHIYTQPDPRAYFTTLRRLDYTIPQQAKPYFLRFIRQFRQRRGVRAPTVLDVGCSYGVNAALLRCDATMDELYRRYVGANAACTRAELITADRDLVRNRQSPSGARFIGLDIAKPALDYARAAGFVDDAVHADLEASEPTDQQREMLAGADLVISTGCLGYVTEKTIARVLGACERQRPWMAHFVLRMFPFQPVADSMAEYGYQTSRVGGLFPQRRFASREEQSLVLDTLATVGVDPRGLESQGWLYAQLYICRPRGTARTQPAREPTEIRGHR